MDCKKIEKEEYSAAQFEHILMIAKMNMDNELRREDSLLTQASHMQTAFAFTTAAIFAALPVCIDNKGDLPYCFFYVWVAVIIFFMLVSLCLASAAQWRFKTKAPGTISSIKETVLNDELWEKYIESSYRCAQLVDMISELYDQKSSLNEKRVKFIMGSMICFFVAIVMICICFIHATCILWL